MLHDGAGIEPAEEIRMNGNETYKKLAEALPWDLQSALLAIRDDGLTTSQIPDLVYIALYELQLIEADGEEGQNLRLSRLGKHLVDYCTC